MSFSPGCSIVLPFNSSALTFFLHLNTMIINQRYKKKRINKYKSNLLAAECTITELQTESNSNLQLFCIKGTYFSEHNYALFLYSTIIIHDIHVYIHNTLLNSDILKGMSCFL